MIYQVSIEGQTIQLPQGIGEKDEDVKRAMTPYFPEVTNAMLTRKVEGETTTITIVKRAGSKGAGWNQSMELLEECQGGLNPVVALYQEIDAIPEGNIIELLALENRIDKALQEGEKQREQCIDALKRLAAASAQPGHVVVMGF